MDKPTVYLDTNIISAYYYEGGDLAGLTRRNLTRDWWKHETDGYQVWASAVTDDELAAGKFRRQAECLRFVRKLRYLNVTADAHEIAKQLVRRGVVPPEKPTDALQMAICAAHQIDYLLSWNYAHLVNPIAQQRVEEIGAELAIQVPTLVSPETIPQARLGQQIRRRRK